VLLRRDAPTGRRGVAGIRLDDLLPLVLGVLVAGLLWLRLPPSARQTVYAEDGSRFLTDALNGPGWRTVFEPYAGYLHVVPRLVGWLASAMPLQDLALVMVVASCGVTGLVAAVVYACMASWVPARLPRAWLSLMTALLPLMGSEVVGTTANLHWLLLWGLVWVVLHRPSTVVGAVGLTLVAVLAGLSEIQVLALLPLVLLRGVQRRHGPAWALSPLLGCVVSAAAQLAATLSQPRPGAWGVPEVASVARLFGEEVLLPLVSADRPALHGQLTGGGSNPVWLAASSALVVVAYVLVRGDVRLRLIAVLCVVLAALLFTFTLVTNPGVVDTRWARGPGVDLFKTRYSIAPELLVLSVVALAWQVASTRADRAAKGVVAVVAVGLLAAGALSFHPADNRRYPKDSWPPKVSAARAVCLQQPARLLISIPVSPTPNWRVRLPCSLLRADPAARS